ncbi:MAG: hypothetical protein MR216_07490, partial [Bacteroidales bacterium]|nr:hypothetical protein [Bacteroidales bacterium]
VLLDFVPHPIRLFGTCRGKTTGKTQKKQHRNQRINNSSIKTEKEDVTIMTHPLNLRLLRLSSTLNNQI